jgi:hypothetical protein
MIPAWRRTASGKCRGFRLQLVRRSNADDSLTQDIREDDTPGIRRCRS